MEQDTIRGTACMLKGISLPKSTFRLSTTAAPTSLPPVIKPATAPGIPLRSRTLEIIFVIAMEQRGVLGDGFQSVALPAASERARFLNACFFIQLQRPKP